MMVRWLCAYDLWAEVINKLSLGGWKRILVVMINGVNIHGMNFKTCDVEKLVR